MTVCADPYNKCLREDYFVAYQAEYIWLDGTEPTAQLRSKTKILDDNVTTPPIWGFDGSSTNQATGDKSDWYVWADPKPDGENAPSTES